MSELTDEQKEERILDVLHSHFDDLNTKYPGKFIDSRKCDIEESYPEAAKMLSTELIVEIVSLDKELGWGIIASEFLVALKNEIDNRIILGDQDENSINNC